MERSHRKASAPKFGHFFGRTFLQFAFAQVIGEALGQFRAPRETCSLNADNDYAAVQAWLAMHESPATQRAYRKEAERLLLWAIVNNGKVNVMPAQSPRLSEDQIKIVASYVWAQSHPVKTASAK